MSQIVTVRDMEAMAYGFGNSFFKNKADDPWLSSTSGAYNAIYGGFAWINANMDSNIFGVLPKTMWDHSGVRIITGKVGNMGGTNIDAFGGTPDGGVIADTVKPPMAVFDVKPKLMQYPFEVAYIAGFLASKTMDDNWGNMSQQRLFGAVQFKEKLNAALGKDNEALALASGAAARTALNRFEQLDVIISNTAEALAFSASGTDWYDPWVTSVVNRDSSSTYDCTVVSASGTLGTRAIITDSLLRSTPLTLHKNSGGFPTVMLTGQDTMNEIEGQYNNQIQYNLLGETMVQLDVNGIQTLKGQGVGMHVTTVYNIPCIQSKDVPKNNASELPRIYYLDTSDFEGSGKPRITMQIGEPVSYYEAGRDTAGWPFSLGKWSEKGLYSILGEVVARNFVSMGKIRDIKA